MDNNKWADRLNDTLDKLESETGLLAMATSDGNIDYIGIFKPDEDTAIGIIEFDTSRFKIVPMEEFWTRGS